MLAEAVKLRNELSVLGVTLRYDQEADRLFATGPGDVVNAFSERIKVEKNRLIVLTLMNRPQDEPRPEWSPADWWMLWQERAAIREFDGGLERPIAEDRALEDTILDWLAQNPAPWNTGQFCAHCNRPETLGNALLPFLTGAGQNVHHVWVHDQCGLSWYQARFEEGRRVITGGAIDVAA